MTLYEKNAIVFDAGPIISFTLSGMLWILEKLKEEYQGKFVITSTVKKEIIDKPLSTVKYKFESIRIMPYLANGTLSIVENEDISKKADEIEHIANSIFFTNKDSNIKIVHRGEVEAIAACIIMEAKTLVIDERTTRYLIEAPEKIKRRLEKKIKKKINIDKSKLTKLSKMLKEIQPIRSTELVTVAFEKNYFNFFEYSNIEKISNFKKNVLEGALWALKSNGCAILDKEIHTIIKLEKL